MYMLTNPWTIPSPIPPERISPYLYLVYVTGGFLSKLASVISEFEEKLVINCSPVE